VSPLFDHLAIYFLYLFVDALALPIASTLYVAHMGARHSPWLVAGLGALATTAGSIGQYLLVRWLVAHPALQRGWLLSMRARIVAAVTGAGHATFWALFVIYATPLGAGPLRLVAAVGGYPLPRFALAILLGCLPYYFAVATLGRVLRLPGWAYAGLIALAVVATGILTLRRWRAGAAPAAGEDRS
jgi:uncharacterized membrane protein YdjX (TVP38/TMEM64 family)